MTVIYISRLERFFRIAAELELDKEDLRRHADFVHRKTHDLLLRAEGTASAHGREAIDLPITKGLGESIQACRRIDDRELPVEPILEALSQLPQLHLGYDESVREALPRIVGGLSYALARCFKIIDPKVKHPHGEHWRAAFEIFDLLL